MNLSQIKLWLPVLALAGAIGIKVAAEVKAKRATQRYAPAGKFVESLGTRLHYVEGGEGRPVVLLHGNDGSHIDFTMSILDDIADEFHAIVFDRPGHGHSSLNDHASSVAMQAAIIHGALEKMGIHKPILLGHSWGGMLALQIALSYPESVGGLMLVSAVSHPSEREELPLTVRLLNIPMLGTLLNPLCVLGSRHEVESVLNDAFYPAQPPRDYVEAFVALLLRPRQIRALCGDELAQKLSLPMLLPLYESIDCPAYIISGDKDRLVRAEKNSMLLHKLLKKSELKIIPNGGHELMFTHQSEIMAGLRALAKKTDRAVKK